MLSFVFAQNAIVVRKTYATQAKDRHVRKQVLHFYLTKEDIGDAT